MSSTLDLTMNRHLAALVLFLTLVPGARPVPGQERFEAAGSESVERYVLPPVDEATMLLADEQRAAAGRVPHYAIPREVALTPWSEVGDWELVRGGGARWRLRIASPGALSLSLAFRAYRMPPGGPWN